MIEAATAFAKPGQRPGRRQLWRRTSEAAVRRADSYFARVPHPVSSPCLAGISPGHPAGASRRERKAGDIISARRKALMETVLPEGGVSVD
ncbi:hypothetical protein SKAU_G00388410 [Synaphobranchus kaupii]|uniref:Uncharacterized protein n=1 Tax=Synaphobranchus kaupii TaxID=118154 RepID=A0A9Q1EB22_SYNKA|nr:hypothetical protein SKAU_G00388410 [Synaphobranchus kaupii]